MLGSATKPSVELALRLWQRQAGKIETEMDLAGEGEPRARSTRCGDVEVHIWLACCRAAVGYPTIRCITYIEGATGYLGQRLNYIGKAQLASYWEQYALTGANVLWIAMRRSTLSRYAGNEATLQQDADDLARITIPLREKLKNGPLQPTMLRPSSARPPTP